MEESKKNAIKIGISVVCLAAAAVLFIKTSSQDSASTSIKGQKIWLKCINEACGAEYQIDLEKFSDLAMEKITALYSSLQAPASMQLALVCGKCGKETAYRAEKCPKCGTVFIVDNSGKCPKCSLGGPEDEKNAAAEKK